MTTDAEIISASEAEPERFAELFDRHYERISRFLRRRLPREVADEVASEVFLAAFQRRGAYDPAYESSLPWLYGIASNLIRRHRRSEGRRLRAYARLPTDDAEPDPMPEAVARSDAQSRRGELAEALATLSDDERDVLVLYAWADLSYAEIAAALELPVGTVRSRLSRARARLGELIPGGGQ